MVKRAARHPGNRGPQTELRATLKGSRAGCFIDSLPRASPWAIVFHAVGVKSRKFMSEPSTFRSFVVSVIEDDGMNVTIEVSEEDCQADLAAGIDEDETMKPGRYKFKRGGFLARQMFLLICSPGRCPGLSYFTLLA